MHLMNDNNAEALLRGSILFYQQKAKRQRALAGLEHVRQHYMSEIVERARMGLPVDDVINNLKRVEEQISQLRK